MPFTYSGGGGAGSEPGGDIGEVQFHDTGAVLAGATGLRIESNLPVVDQLLMARRTAALAAPAANRLALTMERVAGLDGLLLVNEDDVRMYAELQQHGKDLLVLPCNEGLNAGALPGSATTTGIGGGLLLGCGGGSPNLAGISNPVITVPGTLITGAHRMECIAASAAAGQGGGLFLARSIAALNGFLWGGNGARLGGFDISADVATIAGFGSGTRAAFGLTSELAAQDPPDLDDCLLFGWGEGDTDGNWHILHKNAAAVATNIPLDGTQARPAELGGGFFPATPRNATDRYLLHILRFGAAAGWWGIRILNVGTGVTHYEARLTANVPRNTVPLYWLDDRNSGTQAVQPNALVFRIRGKLGIAA